MAELRVKGTGTLKLFESDNTSSVTIASPASLSADKTITLPDADVTLVSGTMNDATALSGTVPIGSGGTGATTLAGAGLSMTPSFRVTLSGNQTLADSTVVLVEFDTESWDTNSAWNTGTYRFTVPSGEAGKYQFNWGSHVETLDLNERMVQALYLNGSSTNFGEVTWHGNGNGYASGTGTVTMALSVADYVDLRIYAGAGTTTTLSSARTFFAGYKLIGI